MLSRWAVDCCEGGLFLFFHNIVTTTTRERGADESVLLIFVVDVLMGCARLVRVVERKSRSHRWNLPTYF